MLTFLRTTRRARESIGQVQRKLWLLTAVIGVMFVGLPTTNPALAQQAPMGDLVPAPKAAPLATRIDPIVPPARKTTVAEPTKTPTAATVPTTTVTPPAVTSGGAPVPRAVTPKAEPPRGAPAARVTKVTQPGPSRNSTSRSAIKSASRIETGTVTRTKGQPRRSQTIVSRARSTSTRSVVTATRNTRATTPEPRNSSRTLTCGPGTTYSVKRNACVRGRA